MKLSSWIWVSVLPTKLAHLLNNHMSWRDLKGAKEVPNTFPTPLT